jgi:hypothetical protein
MSDQFLEQRINIKFCVTLGKNASDTFIVFSEAYRFRASTSKSQMKTMSSLSSSMRGIVRSEFIPQGQTVNETY